MPPKFKGVKKSLCDDADAGPPPIAAPAVAPKAAAAPKSKKRGRGDTAAVPGQPLAGATLAVTLYAESAVSESDDSFKSLIKRVTALGGKYSATVHKRCTFVVATAAAVDQRTQRIRKALKFNVPVVTPAFIDACEASSARPAHAAFVLAVAAEAPAAAKKGGAAEGASADQGEDSADGPRPKKAKKLRGDKWTGAQKVDLGCCCSCHDEGKASCDWCLHAH
ncbi:hypothetical protein M885DRAFT_614771 [Pelagophyceae sp. CCMP2097]|nr:hypothetical protein M885DRAFT_614771 [Pelagophyceae sp. CCMP2097]|mmetsp:Transcript_18399/g.62014  ORF Transcript_18399/g.62014 Transcript_18399/m.62014 type:complete len:222 (+) Transcript_18399:107-772(+)